MKGEERAFGAAGERRKIIEWLREWSLAVGFPRGAILHYVAHRLEKLEHLPSLTPAIEPKETEHG